MTTLAVLRRQLPLMMFAVFVGGALVPLAQTGPAPAEVPGYEGGGVTLLPNGWRIAPAGRTCTSGTCRWR